MTNAELAILSLVTEAPRHGYEIEQIIEARGMREWTEVGFSSIYYLLKKLEKAGFVESQFIPTEGRSAGRRVYRVTEAGRGALLEATLQALGQPQPTYPPILLGVANLPLVENEPALEALRSFRDGITERITHATRRAEAQHPLPDHVMWMFDYSLQMLAAERNWIETVIQKMETQN